MINNTLTADIRKAGYVRCPNNDNRWYPAYSGAKRISLRDVIVTDTIRLMNWRDEVTVEFTSVEAYLAHVEVLGTVPEAGYNVWD